MHAIALVGLCRKDLAHPGTLLCVAAGAECHGKCTPGLGTVQHREAGFKTSTSRDLVGQGRTDFRGFVGLKMALTEPHTVVWRHRHGQDTPACEVIWQLEGDRRLALSIRDEGWI